MKQDLIRLEFNGSAEWAFRFIFIICPLNIVVSVSLNFLLYQSSFSSRIFFHIFSL